MNLLFSKAQISVIVDTISQLMPNILLNRVDNRAEFIVFEIFKTWFETV
jgi:hypothetical protein